MTKTSTPPQGKSGTYLFTSESVGMGHPDKVADQISDAILDAMLTQDPNSRVACETLVTTGLVVVAGEITTKAIVDIRDVVRKTIRKIGYNKAEYGFEADSCGIIIALGQQSPDISQGVTADKKKGKEQGAGDQGLMFGYACKETPELMPLPIHLSHRLVERISILRKKKEFSWMRPDCKSQVTVEYHNRKPKRIDSVVVSIQHDPDISNKEIRKQVIENVILPVLPKSMVDKKIKFYINPTGRFVVGGPHGDCGVTGRKIIVDTYGGAGCHGGGAFSGKDPSKVDRSASYMARHVAKNIVAAGLATRCEVQIAYAIGIAEPVSVLVDTQGTGIVGDDEITRIVRKEFPLRPAGIIEHLNLLRPVYQETAAHGHFGRKGEGFTWEMTEHVANLRKAAGLK